MNATERPECVFDDGNLPNGYRTETAPLGPAPEELHEEAMAADFPVSLATVYNTLHQFTEAGLIRVLAVESSKTYFDTNVSDHHHFFVEGENKVLDIPVNNISIDNLPPAPEGMEIAHVDVVIRLRPKQR
jgi:Fur family iron response transcriptional regulator